MQVIYADVLFFINTAANYLILSATEKICDISPAFPAKLAAASLGGIYSVLATVPNLSFLTLAPVKLSAAVIMLLIVFHRKSGFLRISLVFFAVSAAFGGLVYAAGLNGTPISPGTVIAVLLIAWFTVSIVFRRTGKAGGASTASVSVTCFGKTEVFTALVDTGNNLKDPVSGIGAAVFSQDKIMPLFPSELKKLISGKSPADAILSLSGTNYAGKFRLLPYTAVGVSGGMLLAVCPDDIAVNGVSVPGMVAAISPTPISDSGTFSVLIGTDSTYMGGKYEKLSSKAADKAGALPPGRNHVYRRTGNSAAALDPTGGGGRN